MTQHDTTDPVLAKISRNGEAFWVKNIVQLEPGVFRGIIDNHVVNQRSLKAGDVIAFVESEVKEVVGIDESTEAALH